MQVIMIRKPKAFTLIELLVVIAIIGLLSTIIAANMSAARAKGRDAKRISDMRTIQVALEEYYNDYGLYPKFIYGASSGVQCYIGGAWTACPTLAPTYISVVPSDPNYNVTCGSTWQAGCYQYVAFMVGSGGGCAVAGATPLRYHLAATLEQSNNSALKQDSDADWSGNVSDSTGAALSTTYTICTGGNTNFSGVSSNAGSCGVDTNQATETCLDFTN